jgi:hypothetical protein
LAPDTGIPGSERGKSLRNLFPQKTIAVRVTLPHMIKPIKLHDRILKEFVDGVIELRGDEVWRVARRYRENIIPARPHRRIDIPTKYGSNRIVIRQGAILVTATMREILGTPEVMQLQKLPVTQNAGVL